MEIGRPLRKIVVEPVRDPVPRRPEREREPAPPAGPPAREPVHR